jgi:hypothetical protein
MINNFYDKGVGLEVNCDPNNNSGQVNISQININFFILSDFFGLS